MSGGVIIRSLGAGGGPPNRGFDLWEDDFGVSGQTVVQIRLNYLHYGFNLETQAIGGSNGLVLQGTAVGGSIFCFWIPVAVGGALNRNQFAEFVLENTTGAARGGIAVLVTGDNNQISQSGVGGFNHFYELLVVPGANLSLQRSINNAAAVVLDNSIPVPADGTKIALTAEIQVAQTVLKVYLNDVLTVTVNDNNVNRLTTGLPAFYGRQNTVVSIEFGHFRCGVLSKF